MSIPDPAVAPAVPSFRVAAPADADEVAVLIDQNVAFGERGLLDVTGKARRG